VANIEAYADKMPGMLVGKEVKCWRQFKELATAMDVQTIEKEIQDAIAEYTETLIKGRSRT
jgi:translation initiation factor IF-2